MSYVLLTAIFEIADSFSFKLANKSRPVALELSPKTLTVKLMCCLFTNVVPRMNLKKNRPVGSVCQSVKTLYVVILQKSFQE